MRKKSKTSSHDIGVIAHNIIRSLVDESRIGLFRDITGRDYGIDAIVEVFENGAVTGKIALIQCKGQEEAIAPMKRFPDYVSCKGVSASNLEYALQNNTIVILTFASISDKGLFYFADLAQTVTGDHIKKIGEGQSKVTIRIPRRNNSRDNLGDFWKMIDDAYSKE